MTCLECKRRRRPDGAFCEECTRRYLTAAFGRPAEPLTIPQRFRRPPERPIPAVGRPATE